LPGDGKTHRPGRFCMALGPHLEKAAIGLPAMAALAGGVAVRLLASAARWLGRAQQRPSPTPGVS